MVPLLFAGAATGVAALSARLGLDKYIETLEEQASQIKEEGAKFAAHLSNSVANMAQSTVNTVVSWEPVINCVKTGANKALRTFNLTTLTQLSGNIGGHSSSPFTLAGDNRLTETIQYAKNICDPFINVLKLFFNDARKNIKQDEKATQFMQTAKQVLDGTFNAATEFLQTIFQSHQTKQA